MGDAYPLNPVDVDHVNTQYRTIATQLPHPDSIALLEKMRAAEPQAMEGQPPIVWHHGEGASIFDAYGNKWIDFSSGVLITNAGHGRKEMIDAIAGTVQQGLLTSYCFPNEPRANLVEALQKVAPRPTDRVMLVSTGSEATEICIKLAHEYSRRKYSHKKDVFVTFNNAFHGRTLGSQFAGGIDGLKQWIGYKDEHYAQVDFPNSGARSPKEADDFAYFEKTLADQGIDGSRVCGVMTETYQGGNSSFAPTEYIQKLRTWCDKHDVVLVMDEVQAGFGRTGKFWGFEHYDIVPDLIACGKGISGALPLSGVIGRDDLMDQFPPGSMTSTHSGNPVCSAGVASLQIILRDKLTERAAELEPVLQGACERIRARFSDVIMAHHGKGLVASLHCVKPGTTEPDSQFAWHVIGKAVQSGLMLFAPVGYAGASVKLSPPLCIEKDALAEGLEVLEAAFADVLESKSVTS